MGSIVVEVAPGLASWSHELLTLPAGQEHELDVTGNPQLEHALAAATAAGALVLLGGQPADIVEPDDVSLAKYEAAQAARAPLYELRDEELADAGPNDRDAIIERWEHVMARDAQAALEEGV